MEPAEANLQELVWVEQARGGDAEAFRMLYERHVTPLYRYMNQFSRRVDEVEDWVQRAFVKAYEHLNRFDGRSRFSTWLFQIALNEMRTDQRRHKVLAFDPQEDGDPPSAENESDRFEWHAQMKHWLGQVDDVRRSVFLLHEVEGYSHREIAVMLAIQESHSRTLLTRTRAWLRRQWEMERKAL